MFAFLDADDLWPEGKLKLQIDRFHKDPHLQIVSGHMQRIALENADAAWLRIHPQETVMSVGFGAALIRRNVFKDIGLLDETLPIGEDQDWFLRVREHDIPMILLRNVTLLFQRHDANITNDFDQTARCIKIAMKRSIDRRKALHGTPKNLKPFSSYAE